MSEETQKLSARCPCCNIIIDPAPKRKKACPKCGKPIYIRNGKLLNEFEALREDWLGYLNPLDISKKHFDDARSQLAQQFGHSPGFYDVVWRILNNVIASAGRPNDDVEKAYYEMARVASFEHKDPRRYIAQALTTSLQIMKMRGVKLVVISCYAGEPDFSTCDACRSLHRTKLTIDEALSTSQSPISAQVTPVADADTSRHRIRLPNNSSKLIRMAYGKRIG